MAFAVRKLFNYQNSVDFTNQVCTLTLQWDGVDKFLVDPIDRAALSYSVTIVEGKGRWTLHYGRLKKTSSSWLVALDERNGFGLLRHGIDMTACDFLYERKSL